MPPFTDESIFPTFYSLPTTTDHVGQDREWYMVAQVKNNMTITKPTLIVTDRSGMDFAVTFEEDRGFDLKGRGLKKGNTIVIPKGRRLEKGPGRKDVLVIEKADCNSVKVSVPYDFSFTHSEADSLEGYSGEFGKSSRA
ncbi:zinc mynd-type domain containing protein [Seiridium cupressi]